MLVSMTHYTHEDGDEDEAWTYSKTIPSRLGMAVRYGDDSIFVLRFLARLLFVPYSPALAFTLGTA